MMTKAWYYVGVYVKSSVFSGSEDAHVHLQNEVLTVVFSLYRQNFFCNFFDSYAALYKMFHYI